VKILQRLGLVCHSVLDTESIFAKKYLFLTSFNDTWIPVFTGMTTKESLPYLHSSLSTLHSAVKGTLSLKDSFDGMRFVPAFKEIVAV